MTPNRLAGHILPNEGRINTNGLGTAQPCGPARCSCGATSGVLHSANARRRWHRQHKDEVRAAQTEAVTE